VRVGYISDDIYLSHNTGGFHPESKERLKAIDIEIESIKHKLVLLSPIKVTEEDLALVHPYEHIDYIKRSCKNNINIDVDTVASKDSYNAACAAVGAGIVAINAIKSDKIDRAFTAIRPPGHHATKNKSMGFCLFNNIAITAKYAQSQGYKKVLIIDFDVHHGNGTKDIFYDDPSVFYFSTHEVNGFPGTGNTLEIGIKEGKGSTSNHHLQPRSNDGDILKIYREELPPLVKKFNPDIILVSAGYDIHKDDPLAGLNITTGGIRKLVHEILILKNVPYVFMLEGGYNVDALAQSVKATIEEMLK